MNLNVWTKDDQLFEIRENRPKEVLLGMFLVWRWLSEYETKNKHGLFVCKVNDMSRKEVIPGIIAKKKT